MRVRSRHVGFRQLGPYLSGMPNALPHPPHGPVLLGILERAAQGAVRDLRVEVRLLPGGLESRRVEALTARFRDASDRPRLLRLVAKHLAGSAMREAAVYERVVAARAAGLAPRLLGMEAAGSGAILYLERLRPACAWPWRDVAHAAEVLRCVAALHAERPGELALPAWDYPGELELGAEEALELLRRSRSDALLGDARRSLPAVRRVGGAIRAVHRQLARGPFPPALVHGDLHSGNVVVRSAPAAPRIGLIDWGRVRLGSPLEDVSSFLQSLAYWEPAVRARHDTLLGAYLRARGLDPRPSREVRDAYWLAGATNAFAGALAHHLATVASAAPEPARMRAAHAARDWLRVVRRADEAWSGFAPAAAALVHAS